jgi:ABC-type branched-subunit amino acid transport system ATPase component
MTVIGCAGTGKSVLINTVVGCIQKMFQDNNSVVVAALTGAAAHNVGGQNMHREFKIGIEKNKKWNISKKAKENLSKKME